MDKGDCWLAGWSDVKPIIMAPSVLLNNMGRKGKNLKWFADLTT